MSDYDAVNNPLRRSTFRPPPSPSPPPTVNMASNIPARSSPPQTDPNRGAATAQEAYDILKALYLPLCRDLSTRQFASVLRIFPASAATTQFSQSYGRLEQANLTPQALALCLFCVCDTLHQDPDATPTLLQKLALALPRLERQWKDLPKHTGSTEVLYNLIYGLLAYCAAGDQAITMHELQQIFQSYNAGDPILACFNNWLQHSEVVQVRANKQDKGPFWKNIWVSVRGYLNTCYHSQEPQQHLLIRVMRNMATWHATVCIYEGIQDGGASPYVTSEGALLQVPENAPQHPALPQRQQQQVSPQPMLLPEPDGPVQEGLIQEAASQDGAPDYPFGPYQQAGAGPDGVLDGPRNPFSNLEASNHLDTPDIALPGHPGSAMPNIFGGLPAAPHAQMPVPTTTPRSSAIKGDRCERCNKKHYHCDRERPCGKCRKVGLGADACIPRPPRGGNTKATVPSGGGKGAWVAIPPNMRQEAHNMGEATTDIEEFGRMQELPTRTASPSDMMRFGRVGELEMGESGEAVAGGSFNFNFNDAGDDPKDGDYYE